MDKYGLIGWPIEHSRSPRLFAAAYGGAYPYDLIEGKYFEASYSRFLREYKAINVTAPFKEQAFERADIVSGPAALIGAANILVNTPDGVSAHNSDFTGVILSIAEELWPGIVDEFYGTFGAQGHVKVHQFARAQLVSRYGRKPSALVVGIGGAGKAAAIAAAEMGYGVSIMNRTFDKASAFAEGLPEYGFSVLALSDLRTALRSTDLLIYTLPVALPEITGSSAEDFAARPIILEANYRNPAFSSLLLARALDGGARYISGITWNTLQALSGYSLMTGQVPDFTALLAVK